MKKGELSMEVIIIAAIALLVLVILSVLIIRTAGETGDQTSCIGLGGTCDYDACPDGYGRSFKECPADSAGVCCIPTTARQ